MRVGQRFAVLLAVLVVTGLLASCAPEAERTMHDVYVYGVQNDRLTYFYGGGGTLAYEGGSVELTDAPANDDRRSARFAVDSSLLVDGQPLLRTPTSGPEVEPLAVSRIPQTTDLQLNAAVAVGEVVYYDGNSYLSLVPEAAAGVSLRVVPKPRFNRLRGLGQLTNGEADALADAFESGGAYVMAVLPSDTVPVRTVDGLAEQLRTGIFVQTAIATDQSAFRPAPDQLAWETVAAGNQATGVDDRRFQLITDRQQLTSIWAQAHATQLQPPSTPRVDFSRETLIAIFLGQQRSGGYGVEVVRVSEEGGELYLDVRFTEPAAGAITSQALTSPWTLVRVLRGGYQVAWIRNAADGSLAGAARATF